MSLPSEWAIVRLKEIVVDMQSGFAQRPSEDEGSTPQIRTHNVSPDGHIDLAGIKYVTPSENELERYSLNLQDIIFNNTNSEEWVGKTALFKLEGIYVFSNHMTRIRVNSQLVEPEYLARYLHFLWRAGYYRQRAKRWVSQAAIDQSALSEFKIALPTIPEQQRIVAISRQADELRRLREEVLEQAEELSSSLFLELFGEPLSNQERWPLKKLGDLCTIVRGSSPRPQGDPRFFGGSVPRLMVADLTRDGLYATPMIDSLTEAGAKKSRPMKAGEVVMAVSGAPGLAAILSVDACIHDGFVGFRKLSQNVVPEYLVGALEFFRSRSESQSVGAIFRNLTTNQVSQWLIPLPPQEHQYFYRDFLRELTSWNSTFQNISSQLEQVFLLISANAFIGTLTETWRELRRRELETATRTRDAALAQTDGEAVVTEVAPEERQWLSQPDRDWLLNQLSKEQGAVWKAMRKWHGTLIPAEELDEFRVQCFSNGSLDNTNASILHALDQLAGLGLVVKVSMPNQQGEYITGYRGLREDELSHIADRQALAEM